MVTGGCLIFLGVLRPYRRNRSVEQDSMEPSKFAVLAKELTVDLLPSRMARTGTFASWNTH